MGLWGFWSDQEQQDRCVGPQQGTLPPELGTKTSTGPMKGEEEVFAIIDETGEGFGFELEPGTVAKPLAIASGVLFGVGMLAGIPAGIALGRAEDPKNPSGSKVRPTAGGALLAFRAFMYGTALCGACGVAGAYGVAYHYNTWTWEDFGSVMRDVVPRRRGEIEKVVSPALGSVRAGASEGLPGPTARARDRFAESRIGNYIRKQVEDATSAAESEDGSCSHVSSEDQRGEDIGSRVEDS